MDLPDKTASSCCRPAPDARISVFTLKPQVHHPFSHQLFSLPQIAVPLCLAQSWKFVFPSRICCTSHVFNLLTWHSPSLHPFTFLTQPPVQLCSCGRVSLSFASVTIQCILGRTQPPHFTCPLLRRCLPVAPDCSPLKTAQSLVSLYVTLRILCENFSG